MEEKISLQFDSLSMIKLLGIQLYDTPLAMLRENVQNAVDAIRMRLVKENSFKPHVTVTITDEAITVSDNGIGMSKETLKENFWKAGHSGKNNEIAKEAGVIGHFGIGALANFGVCSRLEVTTHEYGSSVKIKTVANKSELDGNNITLSEVQDESIDYGTTIKAILENKGSIDKEKAIDYLRSFVNYLDIPIEINGEIVSNKSIQIRERSNSTLKAGDYKGHISFHYDLVYNNYQPIMPELLIKDFVIDKQLINGRVYLKNDNSSMKGIMGMCNGFGLALLPVVSNFGFSGFMDFPFLEPTAGREAVSRESIAMAQQILFAIERCWADIISVNPVADNYREFLYYLSANFTLELASQITINEALHNTPLKLSEIGKSEDYIFYAGNDSSVINSYGSSTKTLLKLAQENPKRRVQRQYLQSINVQEVGNKIEVLKVYESEDLEYYESMILIEIKNVIEDDYIITGFDVKFADISMGVLYHVVQHDTGFVIYIARKSPDIHNIIEVYNSNYSLFKPLVKDLVRTSLYNLFASFIPKDKKTRAAYIDRVFNNRREEYTLTPEDKGELIDIYDKIKSKDIDIHEFIEIVKEKTAQKASHQEIDSTQMGDVQSVVKTVGAEETSSKTQNINIDVMSAQPSILELDNNTNKKLLTTDISTPILNNNKMFLALTDRMNRTFRSFFLLPHTTKIIWSMHRIIYIFTDITKSVTLYYEMELTKKLPESQTGGEPIISTTIVTAKRIFVPVIPELYEYFNNEIKNKLTFIVHYDKVIG